MSKKQDQQESRYRFYIKIGCLIVLLLVILIDAYVESFNAPTEVEIALIATIAGVDIKSRSKKKK